mmetsp:Transcript_8420/g.28143  ORF Transcript_8420/g.28143 Transcript_8420/m.28143 type:complete len:332 (-) Transcript_8420:719-1714(-)
MTISPLFAKRNALDNCLPRNCFAPKLFFTPGAPFPSPPSAASRTDANFSTRSIPSLRWFSHAFSFPLFTTYCGDSRTLRSTTKEHRPSSPRLPISSPSSARTHRRHIAMSCKGRFSRAYLRSASTTARAVKTASRAGFTLSCMCERNADSIASTKGMGVIVSFSKPGPRSHSNTVNDSAAARRTGQSNAPTASSKPPGMSSKFSPLDVETTSPTLAATFLGRARVSGFVRSSLSFVSASAVPFAFASSFSSSFSFLVPTAFSFVTCALLVSSAKAPPVVRTASPSINPFQSLDTVSASLAPTPSSAGSRGPTANAADANSAVIACTSCAFA